MSWIRPKRTEAPAQPAPSAPAAAPRSPSVGIPDDDDEIPIEVSGEAPIAAAAIAPAAATPVRPQRADPPRASNGRTILLDDTSVVGTITTASDLWIAGGVEGNIQSSAHVSIAGDGTVVGNVDATRVQVDAGGAIEGAVRTTDAAIAGSVRGPVIASGRLEIAASGAVIGDVSAQNLQVADGATLQGRCTMTRSR